MSKYNDLTTEKKSIFIKGFASLPFSATMINEALIIVNPYVSFNKDKGLFYMPYFTELKNLFIELKFIDNT